MSEQKTARTLTGVVKSAKRLKTVTVEVSWSRRHPQYGKVMQLSSKYHVHDADSASHEGDLVEIKQCRPISKTKTWELVRVVKAAQL